MGKRTGDSRHTPLQRTMRKTSHRVTWWIGRNFSQSVPLVFVLGYPKSGTTWMCQLAADYLQLPFPRFSILPVGCPAVVHGHETIHPKDPRGIYSIRDGRDALVSYYFHLARWLPEGDRPQLNRSQKGLFPGLVNKADVSTNLPRFVEQQLLKPAATRVNWGRHALSFLETRRDDWAMLKYEDLLADGPRALGAAMERITGKPADEERVRSALDRFSFTRQSGRKAGEESRASFLRKGQAGDWRNHFTREMAEMFDRHCGKALIGAGYEPDSAWVQQCPALYQGESAPVEAVAGNAR